MSMTIGGESGFHGIAHKMEKKEDKKRLNMGGSEKKADFNEVIGDLVKSNANRRLGRPGGSVGGSGRQGGPRGTLA